MTRKVLLGIDIGGTNVKFASVGVSGKVFSRGVIPTYSQKGPEDVLKRIKAAADFIKGANETFTGAGIGCAGLVDFKKGILITSPNLPGWERTGLRAAAKRILGLPAVIDNDANAAAVGEYRLGTGRHSDTFICLTLGTGVGGGVICGGNLLRGAGNFAGEIGHMSINEKGPLCACGSRGCLESFIGAKALAGLFRKKLRTINGDSGAGPGKTAGMYLSPRSISKAAASGNRAAKEVLREAGIHLGCAIASLVNIFNPEVIAVTGGVSGALKFMRKSMEKEINARAFRESARMVKIVEAKLGKDASMVGAALLAKKQ